MGGLKPSGGELITLLIMQWFNKFDPYWQEDLIMPRLVYLATLLLEIKMAPVFSKIKHNLINGGWPQLLWN